MNRERQILRMWERGYSQAQIAYVFDETPYRVRKSLKSTLAYDTSKQIHNANSKNLRRTRSEKVRERQRFHPDESKRASRFYVRSHEALGQKTHYDPSEEARLKRILEREGSP